MKLKTFILLFLSLTSLAFSQVYKNNVEASYYADKFHGRKTSSGEVFNMYDYTCAHKTFPFGTVLRVTNLANNKTVDVRVNDRGPFVAGREVDLSKAAAVKLDMIKSGTARVKIEILNSKGLASAAGANEKSGQKENKNLKVQEVSRSNSFCDIQMASFSNRENAENLAHQLIKLGFDNVYFQKTNRVTRVVLKKVPSSQLSETEEKLQQNGYRDYLIKRNVQ